MPAKGIENTESNNPFLQRKRFPSWVGICRRLRPKGKQNQKTFPRFSHVSLKTRKGKSYEKVSISRAVCTVQSTGLGAV